MQKRKRSKTTSAKLVDSAITIVAEEGLSCLSHRRLAQVSNCSLALTTYYFPKKTDIVAALCQSMLQGYLHAFDNSYDKFQLGEDLPSNMWAFCVRVICSTVGENSSRGMAWAEIYLDGNRRKESEALVTSWVIQMLSAFRKVASVVEPDLNDKQLQCRVDMVIGVSFIALALGLSTEQIRSVLIGGQNPLMTWKPTDTVKSVSIEPTTKPTRSSKSVQTEAHILNAAINVIVKDGASGLTYARLAAETGLAGTAPSYYYPSISVLLERAQIALFDAFKERYQEITAPAYSQVVSMEQLTDLTAFMLQREVQLFGNENLALYQLWIEAERRIELREMIWNSIVNQINAWDSLYEDVLGTKNTNAGTLSYSLVIGKLIRLLSAGGLASELVSVRSEFAAVFSEFEKEVFPSKSNFPRNDL